MIAKPMESRPSPNTKQHTAFFRQSGWLMIASIAGGVMSYGVHFLGKRIDNAQYSIFGMLLMATACLPTLPLQMMLAQQTASALATNRQRQLASIIRLAAFWIFALWSVAALVILIFQNQIALRWGLTDVTALWITLLIVLISLWSPMFGGALQGKQDFLWMGWSAMSVGIARVTIAAVMVLGFTGGATSMMTGALIGLLIGLAIAVWRTRDLWCLPAEQFDRAGLLRQVIPLMLGFWACQFMFTADTIIAKAFFSDSEMAPYVSAGTLARALLWLVMPLASVMFPKLVHSHAKSEKSNLMGIVLAGTAALSICGGLGLWLVGPLLIKFVGKPEWVESAKALLPWYALAMVPLALANVLANDLLARGRFRVVPVIVFLAVAYGFTLPYVLNHYPRKLETVLQILAGFNFLLLAVCSWAAFGKSQSKEAVATV